MIDTYLKHMQQLNDDNYTEKHLQKWRESAEDFGLIEKLADAHYYTGEHFLNQVKINWKKKKFSIALLINIVTMILTKRIHILIQDYNNYLWYLNLSNNKIN